MKTRRYIVGVDGGATKTLALIGDEKGKVLGRGESGSSNYHNIGATAASLAVNEAVRKAKKQAGIRAKPQLAVVALAAVDCQRDKAVVARSLHKIGIAQELIVVHDSEAALRAVNTTSSRVVVISGTGCVAAGVNQSGQYARAGGWGYLIDDEGSAFNIGAQALRSAFRMIDGRAPKTKLAPALREKFRVRMLEASLASIYSEDLGVDGIADLTSLVSKLAPTDNVSRGILDRAGASLGELVCAVARKLRITNDTFPVFLVGGTFKAGPYLLRALQARIRKGCPHARVELLRDEPVLGALSLAVAELQNRGQRRVKATSHRAQISRPIATGQHFLESSKLC